MFCLKNIGFIEFIETVLRFWNKTLKRFGQYSILEIGERFSKGIPLPSSSWGRDSFGIPLSRSSCGRDSLPELVISVGNPCARAPTKGIPCLGATVERIPYQIVHFSRESWSQRSPKGISLSRSSCGEGSLPNWWFQWGNLVSELPQGDSSVWELLGQDFLLKPQI